MNTLSWYQEDELISVKEEAVVKTSEKWHDFVSTDITPWSLFC